ncbi:MAG: anthranilate synthase component I [Victivallales bacterium]|nr:anthranilate synthase component I [Victivallales bacterium]
MFKPNYEEFVALSRQGNIVPVFSEQIADLETPVSVLSRFVEDENMFLLESVEGGERWARYSFIGVNPYAVFQVKDGKPYLTRDGQTEELPAPNGPMMAMREVLKDAKPVEVPGLPPFFGGAVGYMCYETINEFEKLPEPKQPLPGPTACFMLTDEMIIFDNIRHTVMVSVCAHPDRAESPRAAYDAACARVNALSNRLKAPAPVINNAYSNPPALRSNMSREYYNNMVHRGKEYIKGGDIIQVVLSQRFSTRLTVKPIQLYRALRLINPSPYTFMLKFDGRILIGSSPEVMVRLNGNKAELRPIAGTRRRGKTEQEDRALADELLRDEKERAEHVMLVDLGRNDLGRVAVPASVQVRDFMTIERYSHVMHIVSTVESILAEGKDCFDLLRATFPAGTLSGAPKIRAMEIIHELEPEPRGVYGGTVGYFGYNHSMDMAITIRTLLIEDDKISVQAGGGIVYDSEPDKELMETVNKATAVFKAIELASHGLELA